jgi:hypothetical protein
MDDFIMSKKEKFAYLKRIKLRYDRGSKDIKSRILEEFCEVCRYNRKYAIRLLNSSLGRAPGKPGRVSKYIEPRFMKALKQFWFDTDQLCSKKLKLVIPTWLPFFENERGKLASDVKEKLLKISAASIDRVLKPTRVQYGKGRTGTKPGTLLRTQIPIRTDFWDVTTPGYFEADTVAHCGTSMAGEFIWSLTMTDIYSGWTESRSLWNKGSSGVIEQIKDVENSLSFPLLAFDSDNGAEFLNTHLVRYFSERSKVVPFTRSRPYHKNDNAHVEQKNWSHVRQLLGYKRLENPEIVPLINDLYKNEWSLYQNHFVPTFKLLRKEKIKSRYHRLYQTPITPYERLINSDHISQEKKKELMKLHHSLNPYHLKREKERKLKLIFSLTTVTSIMRQRI